MIRSLPARFSRLLDGPELTPHQAWRVRVLCDRLADKGGSSDDREIYRDLEDALKCGLRSGFFYAQDAETIIGLTESGYLFVNRSAQPRIHWKRPPLFNLSVGLCAILSAAVTIASLFAAQAERTPLAAGGMVGLLICTLGLMDGPPPEPSDD